MDLLQRIQLWYTIHCDGDWEFNHSISITNLSNPGWWVTIDLHDTCLAKATLPKDDIPITEHSSNDWTMWYVENQQFIASGGPQNLSEILSYFLDVFLPANIDSECTFDILLPLIEYEDRLWLRAEARMLSESVLEIVTIAESERAESYEWNSDADMNLFNELDEANLLSSLRSHYKVDDPVVFHIIKMKNSFTRTFIVAPTIE